MIIASKKAHEKWCPFVRLMKLGSGANEENLIVSNRYNDKEMSRCIAGECMAWEWVDDENKANARGFCGAIAQKS